MLCRLLSIGLVAASLPLSALAKESRYEFLLNKHNLQKFERFLDGRDPLTITEFGHPYADRHTMELFWFKVAPVLGGCDCQIDYKGVDTISHARAILQVKSGHEIAHPIAGFEGDPRYEASTIVLSEPILEGKDFFVGLFTEQGREEILALDQLQQVKNLRVAVSETWPVDISVIEDHQLPLLKTVGWVNILRLIKKNRADVVLQPFSPADDLGFDDEELGTRFLPIPGFKIAFNYGRRYIVSAQHPDSDKFVAALNRGIRRLRSSGLLMQGHRQSGVIDTRVDDWVLIE